MGDTIRVVLADAGAPGAPASCAPSAAARLRLIAGGWALLYAAYRGYYALGGTAGMFGTPVSFSQWRFINEPWFLGEGLLWGALDAAGIIGTLIIG